MGKKTQNKWIEYIFRTSQADRQGKAVERTFAFLI